jgi:hypothetical protein
MKRTDSHVDSPNAIAQVLDRLREEFAIVHEVLDDIRDELQWANRNLADPVLSRDQRFRLTSMPLDPGAKDWQLNRVDEATMEKLRTELPSASKPGVSQSRLF